jgi:hypothetical protein
MDAVIEHAQQLIFVDAHIKESLFQQSEGIAEKEPMGRQGIMGFGGARSVLD